MEDNQASKSAKTSLAWLETEEGKKHFRERMEMAEKNCEEMRKALIVDREVLLEPMTI